MASSRTMTIREAFGRIKSKYPPPREAGTPAFPPLEILAETLENKFQVKTLAHYLCKTMLAESDAKLKEKILLQCNLTTFHYEKLNYLLFQHCLPSAAPKPAFEDYFDPQMSKKQDDAAESCDPQWGVSFGCKNLDDLLGDGLQRGMITEIAGEASCGKSQFGAQLLLHTAIEGKLPVLINTEADLLGRTTRMREMAIHIVHNQSDPSSPVPTPPYSEEDIQQGDEVLNRVMIHSCRNSDELDTLVNLTIPHIFSESNERGVKPGCLVIDSIASIYRNDASVSIPQRSNMLFALSAALKRIAVTWRLPVLVLNQVTDFVAGSQTTPVKRPAASSAASSDDDPSSSSSSLPSPSSSSNPPSSYSSSSSSSSASTPISSTVLKRQSASAPSFLIPPDEMKKREEPIRLPDGRFMTAALGLAWSCCVNIRIFLARTKTAYFSVASEVPRRSICVVFSPCVPSGEWQEFKIEAAGIHIPD